MHRTSEKFWLAKCGLLIFISFILWHEGVNATRFFNHLMKCFLKKNTSYVIRFFAEHYDFCFYPFIYLSLCRFILITNIWVWEEMIVGHRVAMRSIWFLLCHTRFPSGSVQSLQPHLAMTYTNCSSERSRGTWMTNVLFSSSRQITNPQTIHVSKLHGHIQLAC